MRILTLLILFFFGGLLVYATLGLPNRGDVQVAPHWEVSPVGSPGAQAYYIRHAVEHTATPNIVTAVLADYRGYDTLGETVVIFTAGITCFLLLRRKNE